jgi:hypothetical protein
MKDNLDMFLVKLSAFKQDLKVIQMTRDINLINHPSMDEMISKTFNDILDIQEVLSTDKVVSNRTESIINLIGKKINDIQATYECDECHTLVIGRFRVHSSGDRMICCKCMGHKELSCMV